MKNWLGETIVKSEDYLKELEETYGVIRYDVKPPRQWYSRDERVFFDCDEMNLEKCLENLLEMKDLTDFSVFIVAKESKTGGEETKHVLRSITYKNLGNQDMRGFIHHFSVILEYPMSLELQLYGLEYVKCVGFSYSTPEEVADLERRLANVKP